MCAAPNLANLATWQSGKCQELNDTPDYSAQHINNHPLKAKLSSYRMLIINTANNPEDCNFSDGEQSKYFTSPIRPFQLTTEECNELLMKRSTLASETSQNTLPEDLQNSLSDNLQNSDVNGSLTYPKLRPYCCLDCGKTFIQKHHLTTHRKVHSGIRPHACEHCGKAFTHKHCLNTHLLLHSSERPYQCSECRKSFTLKHHLISHGKVHSREKPFICTDCGCAFPLKRHLVTHSKFHAGERPFVCEDCGESFAHKDHLVMHSRFHGFTNSFACHECSATFTRKFELVNHSRLHGHVPLRCPICDKEFMQKRTLVVHMRVHAETTFTCHMCGENFHLRNELAVHMTTHYTSSNTLLDKPLLCPECGNAFSNPETLTMHIKLHSSDSSLVSNLCSFTANLQGSHFPTKMNSKVLPAAPCKPKLHICQACGKAFSAKHGLQQHNKRHPDGRCIVKSHVCETCDKAFFQKNHLLLHQRQHLDPSLRTASKLQSTFEAKSLENGDSFYDQSHELGVSVNSLDVDAKPLCSENAGDANFVNKKEYYLSRFMPDKKPVIPKQENLESYAENESYTKNNFQQHHTEYDVNSLKNVDNVRTQVSDEVIDHTTKIKSENINFTVIEQTVM